MKKNIVRFVSVFLVIGFSCLVITNVGNLVLTKDYSVDEGTYFNCEFTEGDSTDVYDDASLVVEIEFVGNSIRFEKNVVSEARVVSVLKGNAIQEGTIKIVEPLTGFNGYIPLKENNGYIVLLKECKSFEFETYQFIDSIVPYYKNDPKFYDYDDQSEHLLKLVNSYDYISDHIESYNKLRKYLIEKEYLK